MKSKAVVFGCSGLRLTGAERRFFARTDPLGLIVFARNVEAPDQLRALTAEFRESVGRADAPVLVDQEGGRVQRLRPPHWRAAPAAARFGELAFGNKAKAAEAARLNARLLAGELAAVGIDTVCAPVLDLRFPGAHDVIGDRAFAGDPAIVSVLGRAAVEGFLAAGVTPIMKHIPGHGRSLVDSHLSLPVVEASRAELEASDFRPFKALADVPWAMTAHLLYSAIDGERPATMSARVVGEVIRGHIGFEGVLIGDDLSMQALSGSIADRAAATLAAGCDLALHCNGKMEEMEDVAEATRAIGDATARRLDRARATVAAARRSSEEDAGAMATRLEALLAAHV
ncbi:MAG TPA: beta-N-acetylhexosaminidase [Candidatus Udaeobacter sp.]|nr:beta-N-acetylhexosaminidase [Candidatus Udaeobacter sp.]